ncbi:MAG: flippase [Anaerolineae bacterium]
MNQAPIKSLPHFIRTRLGRHHNLQKTLENTGWLFADRVLSMGVGFFVSIWVVRYLGPEQFGLYSYALSFVALFGPLVNLGLDNIVVRNLVRNDASPGEILGTAFTLKLMTALVTFALVAAVIWQLDSDPLTRVLVLIIAGGLIFRPLNVIDFWFQSQVLSKYVVWARNTALVICAAIKVGLVLAEMPLIAFAWVWLAQSAITGAGLLFMFRLRGPVLASWRPRLKLGMTLLRDAWPLVLSGLAASIYMKIDQIMLGRMVGSSAVGIYAAAVRLSELWYFIPMAVAASVFPAIVHSRQSQSEQVYRKRIQTFYDVMAGLGYAVAIPLGLFASPLVTTLFGADYAEAGPILAVHIWAFIFVCLGVARGKWLIAENMTGFSMFTSILGAVVNVGLNYWLMPRYAGLGAAWATLISYAVAAYLSCILSSRLWPVFSQLSLSLLVPFRLSSLRRSFREVL